MQNFVSVALTTAAGGEGDFTNDQLSNLRTVVGGFGSLIYDLKSHMGFLEFRDCCKSLWDSLDHTNNYTLDLSTLLVSLQFSMGIIKFSVTRYYLSRISVPFF